MTAAPPLQRVRESGPRRRCLLDADPDLAAGIPVEDEELARQVLTLCLLDREAGPLELPEPESLASGAFALLVAEGRLLRETPLGDRVSAGLCGAGEVISPWEDPDAPGPPVGWVVREPVELLVLDARFTLAIRRWPGLAERYFRRLVGQSERLRREVAIAHICPVEQRLLALLWHIAADGGQVTPDGVVLPLRLTHEALGHLLGSQRPTVSLAATALQEAGLVTRRRRGVWVLHGSAPAIG